MNKKLNRWRQYSHIIFYYLFFFFFIFIFFFFYLYYSKFKDHFFDVMSALSQ